MKVTMDHVRTVPGFSKRPGLCAPKVRRWFEARGLSFRDFLDNGMDVEQLEGMDDAFAQGVAAHARQVEGVPRG